jgi:hypothetical protein
MPCTSSHQCPARRYNYPAAFVLMATSSLQSTISELAQALFVEGQDLAKLVCPHTHLQSDKSRLSNVAFVCAADYTLSRYIYIYI